MRQYAEKPGPEGVPEPLAPTKPNGPALAAILAAGVGSFALGLLTTLAAASPAISNLLNLYAPVGPLAGKTVGEGIIWLVSWGVLAYLWKGRDLEARRIFTITLILIGLGLLGTFPVVYEALAPTH